jgi:WD40 repeat protein
MITVKLLTANVNGNELYSLPMFMYSQGGNVRTTDAMNARSQFHLCRRCGRQVLPIEHEFCQNCLDTSPVNEVVPRKSRRTFLFGCLGGIGVLGLSCIACATLPSGRVFAAHIFHARHLDVPGDQDANPQEYLFDDQGLFQSWVGVVNFYRLSNDGQYLAIAFQGSNSDKISESDKAHYIIIYEVKTGKPLVVYDGHIPRGKVDVPTDSSTHETKSFLEDLSWSPGDHLIASIDVLNHLHVWQGPTGQNVWSKEIPGMLWSSTVQDISWSPDGKYLAFAPASDDQDDVVSAAVLRARDGTRIDLPGAKLTGSADLNMTNFTYPFAWSPESTFLAVCTPTHILLWETSLWHLKQKIAVSEPLHLSCSPDGKYVAFLEKKNEQENLLSIWEMRTGKRFTWKSRAVGCYAWSPSGNTLACGADSDLIIIEPQEGKILKKYTGVPYPAGSGRGQKSFVFSLSWFPDGKRLLIDSGDFLRIQQV